MGSFLYALIIYPLEMFIETVFSISMEMVPSAGYAIIFVSLAVQLLVLPLYKRADELQEEERERQREMAPAVKHIKKTFKGDERVMMLSMYYRFENYHTYHQLKGILPLLLQIPFFMAAYNFLSGCSALDGASFYFLKDMGKPDGMITVGGIAINVMPILMTLINVVSGAIYTRGLELKDKLQLYITAGIFLVILYDSPSGLVFYWTLNNVFSLFKNIFMKLVKHPREIASAASVLFGGSYSYKCISRGAASTSSGRIVIAIIMAASLIPAAGMLLDKYGKGNMAPLSEDGINDECKIFRISGIISAITMGILIPIVTIASSPTEFVIRGHYVNPAVHVLYSFLVALGLFVLWGNIIFSFNSQRTKKILSCAMFAIAVCSLVNSQFFRQGLKNMSMHMVYFDGFGYDSREKLINGVIIIIILTACCLIFRYKKKAALFLGGALAAVTIVMSAYNFVIVQRALNHTDHLKDDLYYTENTACYNLDRKGKNVVVLFEDRAFGQFLPYILNEKPELEDIYSGFTYYANTISYGTRTMTGAPPMYGGYEYTPYTLRDKDDEFVNNCVKVMPKIFASNGFLTTVFDKPHFIDLTNSSIEEFYHDVDPSINAYYADGVVKTKEEAERDYQYFEKAARHNYIRHSIFLSAPLAFRKWIYDEGKYLSQFMAEDSITFAGHIEELNKLGDMAKISNDGSNTFTLIENDTTHSMDVNLQMPDYTLAEEVDNSEYIDKWREKLTDAVPERMINMNTETQLQAYQVNMAALLSIGRWIEYLKENDLYDNTRIIIVADHGYSFFTFDDMIMDNGGEITDLDMFTPLLMVKDFCESGDTPSEKIVTSDEFMTNADTAIIALEGLVDDPVNPYTGASINNAQKYARKQYIFDDRIWLSVEGNIYDPDNWETVKIDGVEH